MGSRVPVLVRGSVIRRRRKVLRDFGICSIGLGEAFDHGILKI